MKKKDLRKIIAGYMSKGFSTEGKKVFPFWMRIQTDAEEKEEVLEELWNASHPSTSIEVYQDWCRLQEKIGTNRKKRSLRWLWTGAAAVLLMAATAVGTMLVTEKFVANQPTRVTNFTAMHGERRNVMLSDGTEVWINAGSMLLAPEDFEKTDRRDVYLVGEAHFDVAQDKSKPFVVHTSKLEVEALGTQFTISSYFNEKTTHAILEEGSIQVKVNDVKNHQVHILKPLEKLIYNHFDSTVEIKRMDNERIKLCQQGYVIFENASFKEIIGTIERQYNVVFQYNKTRYENGLYNIKFSPREDIKDVLQILQELLGIKYSIKGRTVYLK